MSMKQKELLLGSPSLRGVAADLVQAEVAKVAPLAVTLGCVHRVKEVEAEGPFGG